MTPLAIDQWGWTKEDAILYLGIVFLKIQILGDKEHFGHPKIVR